MGAPRELTSLHTALIDVSHGYERAMEDTKAPQLKELFGKMLDVHRRGHAVLHNMLAEMGDAPDEAGSFMSTVHETVINVRSAVVGLDEGSLSSFASGEENTLAKYDAAIGAMAGSPRANLLVNARDELHRMIEEMNRRAND